MTRAEVIAAIKSNKERAIGLGFDWPTIDIYEATNEELLAFLWEIEEFLESN
jgi:hypothetical protein